MDRRITGKLRGQLAWHMWCRSSKQIETQAPKPGGRWESTPPSVFCPLQLCHGACAPAFTIHMWPIVHACIMYTHRLAWEEKQKGVSLAYGLEVVVYDIIAFRPLVWHWVQVLAEQNHSLHGQETTNGKGKNIMSPLPCLSLQPQDLKTPSPL